MVLTYNIIRGHAWHTNANNASSSAVPVAKPMYAFAICRCPHALVWRRFLLPLSATCIKGLVLFNAVATVSVCYASRCLPTLIRSPLSCLTAKCWSQGQPFAVPHAVCAHVALQRMRSGACWHPWLNALPSAGSGRL
jgi:hypothetical protein